jgi:hypothetical protein
MRDAVKQPSYAAIEVALKIRKLASAFSQREKEMTTNEPSK